MAVPFLLRDRGARVGLPWIAPARDRFIAAWLEEGDGGWSVMTRVLGPGTRRSDARAVSTAPFRFREASLTHNIGDYLSVTASGDAFWVAWSDTVGGSADIRIARGELPR